ncbi:MAG: hypothetical protein DVB23_001003 [Verrucomicrobia bacterium]|jgi:hypothetical protein|nr:MAG: hypothetical protein DVB23_001003 [Verrucomicrobiota bacterium]
MTATSPTESGSGGIRDAIRATLYQNRWACLGLNLAVAGLVASYYRWPASALFWEALGEWKTRGSYLFSAVATVLAAVVLPTVVQRLMGMRGGPGQARRLGWGALYWAYRGIEIDWFYRLQGRVFGTGTDGHTVAIKLLVDQFGYSVFWAVPSYLLFVLWVEHRSLRKAFAAADRALLRRSYLSVLLTNWLVWLPAVALVYSLPPPLQFPLFSMILTFYILLITVLVKT